MATTGDTTNEERPFPCPDCAHRSKTREALRRHGLTHVAASPFQCNLCQFRTKWKENLKAHINRHTGEASYKHSCTECEKRFAYPSELSSHVRSAHRADRPFPCPQCDYRTKTKSRLRLHLRVHDEEKGPRRFECHFCAQKFKEKNTLDFHIKLHTGESAVTCPRCGKTLSSASTLRNHINSVHNARARSHQCRKCDYKAMSSSILKVHMAVHEDARPFTCSFCDYAAKCQSTLVKHMQLHTGEKGYVCNLCPFSSAQRGPLNRHQKMVHLGDESKPFKCQSCLGSFSTKGSLKTHEATHKEARPFKCDQCPYAGKLLGLLTTHKLQVHSGRKEHKCPLCGSAFPRGCNLLQHLKTHTGEKPFTCSQCSYATLRKGDLKKHEQTHLEDKVFECKHCSYTGPRLDLLKEHWRRKHREGKPRKRSAASAKDPKLSLILPKKQLKTKFQEVSLLNNAENDLDSSRTKTYKCRQCASNFNQNVMLALHYTVEHSLPKIILHKLTYIQD